MSEEEQDAGAAVPLLEPAAAKREESKMLCIVGPAIVQRVALYGINAVSHALIGHIGNLELAAFSIASTVVVNLNFGFLVGMASGLDTVCRQAYDAKEDHKPSSPRQGVRRQGARETLCGQGVYLQRSWLVLLLFAAALTPTYVFVEDLLLLVGQTPELSRLAGKMTIWLLPQHFAMALLLPLTRFLQSQLKNWVTAVTAGVALAVHLVITYLVHHFKLGFVGAVACADVSWWLVVLGQLSYVVSGGCQLSWKVFSMDAFADFDLWHFMKLSAVSGVKLWCGRIPGDSVDF